MNSKTRLAAAFVLAALGAAAGPVTAQSVDLRFTPADTTIAPGTDGRLAIVIDQPLSVRTIDVTVSFDTTVVRSVGGGPGRLYAESGLNIFQGWQETAPGVWWGYAVVLGDSALHGPGELYRWDLTGLTDGVSPVTAVEVYLSDLEAIWYETVNLAPTTVVVGTGLSGAAAMPGAPGSLRLQPNPFNPRTEILLEATTGGPARLEVCDLRGRRVALLFAGELAAGPFRAFWDGRDGDGRTVPGGVYLFRLSGPREVRLVKGLLLK